MTKGKDDVPQDHYIVRSELSCMKNTVKCVGYGAVIGVTASLVVAQNAIPTVSFLEIAGRSVARYIFPATFLGAVFASTTCLLDETRGRQYPVSNGFMGGVLAGAALGCRSHQLGKVASYGFLGGLLGGAARLVVTNGMLNINSQDQLNQINSSLYMNDLRHLAPPSIEK